MSSLASKLLSGPVMAGVLSRGLVEVPSLVTEEEKATAPAALAVRASSARLRRAMSEHFEVVWRCLRRLGVAAPSLDDAAQQVMVVLARRIDEVHEGAERAFMIATATRVAADFRKKQTRSREVADSEGLEARASLAPSVDELIDRGRARDLLDLALAELPAELRTIFVLFELEELTMASIAEMLALPPGTVASRLRRGRESFESTVARLSRCKGRP